MLKSRRIFPPGGWKFFQPQTGWQPDGGLDFDQTVTAIISHRQANPRFNLPTERGVVEAELDVYTCLRIANNPHYCDGPPAAIPKANGLSPSTARQWTGRNVAGVVAGAKALVAGVNVLIDWLGSGGMPVAAELAEQRASICADCPQNKAEGVLFQTLTQAASEMIRKQLEIRQALNLSTHFDAKLGVCGACLCPMKLKVWTPMTHILKHLQPEQRSGLDPRCWILHEKPETKTTQAP